MSNNGSFLPINLYVTAAYFSKYNNCVVQDKVVLLHQISIGREDECLTLYFQSIVFRIFIVG